MLESIYADLVVMQGQNILRVRSFEVKMVKVSKSKIIIQVMELGIGEIRP